MIPGIFDNSDYVSRYYAFRNYGFVAMQVNIKRNKTNSMYTYFPAFYDSSLGLRDYGSEEKSKMTYVNFFDGIYTGRAFKNESAYATVSYVTTQKKSDWYKNVAELIAKYNLNKSLIEEYKKDPDFDVSLPTPDEDVYKRQPDNSADVRACFTACGTCDHFGCGGCFRSKRGDKAGYI